MKQFTDSNQLKAFMKKESARLEISIPNVYHTFMARRLLEKISEAGNKHLLVKGSAAETAYLGELVRGITDLDLASIRRFNVNRDFIQDILTKDDGRQFDFSLKKVPYKTPTGIIKLNCTGSFDTIKQDFSIDFEENYNRLFEKEKRTVPVIFEGDEPFDILVPSFEEYLAEKLCIIVESNKPDVLNTRLKDFYDIYQLHGGHYDSKVLTKYFGEMLEKRAKIKLEDANTTHLNTSFIKSHRDLWDGASIKYDFLDKELDFNLAVGYTRAVLREYLYQQGKYAPHNSNIEYTKKRVR
jgi:predicted nucleotidyltransferase component of viral defense system